VATYNTKQKGELIEFFKDNKDACFTAKQITEAAPTLPRSTVYRLLEKLCDDGSLKKDADEKTGESVYRYYAKDVCSHHLHMKCLKCGRIIHLNDMESEKIIREINSQSDFKVCIEGSMLSGICKNCM